MTTNSDKEINIRDFIMKRLAMKDKQTTNKEMIEKEFFPYWAVINWNPGFGASPRAWIDSEEKFKECCLE